jgi:hypothetical protein
VSLSPEFGAGAGADDAVMALVEQVMTCEPYASAKRVFWVVDNGSSHRGQAPINRLAVRFPNAVMVHTPVHASWLNQAEIFLLRPATQSGVSQRLHGSGRGEAAADRLREALQRDREALPVEVHPR